MMGCEPPTRQSIDKCPMMSLVIKETLRLYPPAIIGRKNQEERRCGPYTLPKETELFINLFVCVAPDGLIAELRVPSSSLTHSDRASRRCTETRACGARMQRSSARSG